MTIFVLGASGQIGTELLHVLQGHESVVGATRSGRLANGSECHKVDFAYADAVVAMLEQSRPRIVINAAAHTAVDRAEDEAEAAYVANAATPAAIAIWCAAHDVPLVHYSTDYVFDGTATRPYRPDDVTAPLGVYGASKLAGEDAIRAAGGRHLIFRTGWVYAAHGHNFLRTMLRLGAERDVLRVVADQVGTPTPAALIADVTAQALRHRDASGTWHLTAEGETSWHGFAEAIFAGAVERGLLPRAPGVEAITTADYPTPAKRPAYSRLDTTTLQRDFGVELPHWTQGLGQVLDQLAAQRD